MATDGDTNAGRGHDVDLAYTDDEAARIEADPIRITLSGHTCSGKTEWLSSLLCARIGDTSPMPDTTRQITWETRDLAGRPAGHPYVMIADVPGQQFSSEILAIARRELGPRPRPRQMEAFIERYREVGDDHQSDIRLLDHFRACDVILYLADCQNEPAVAIEDEFELVRRLGRPVIAVLNFSGSHTRTARATLEQWREAFAMEGAWSVIELDAFDKDPAAIRELGVQLENVFDGHPVKAKFMRKYWHEEILAREEEHLESAVQALADFLLNAATYSAEERLDAGADRRAAERTLKQTFRELVLRKLAELPATLVAAYPESANARGTAAAVDDALAGGKSAHRPGPFGDTPFRQIPKSLGRGALIGAAIGLAVDAMVGGISGGGGTILGASIGAAVDLGFSFKVRRTPLGSWGSRLEIQLSDRTLKTCCLDGLALIDALRRRGVASTAPLNVDIRRKHVPSPAGALKMLSAKRSKHAWSLWSATGERSARRQAFRAELASELKRLLDEAPTPA